MNRRRFFTAVFVPFAARYSPVVAPPRPNFRLIDIELSNPITREFIQSTLCDARMLLERQAVFTAHRQGLAKFERLIERYKSGEVGET